MKELIKEENVPEKEPLLKVEELVVKYVSDDETVHAVNDVSFSLDYGQTLGIVGETGAGKTTIAKSIMRILPALQGKVDHGRILFNGQDLLTMSADEMRKVRSAKISMIFQDPMTALNPVMRVVKQIAESIHFQQNLSWKEAYKKAEDMLELVGIGKERARAFPHQFSGGMKQRVVIAIALACNPTLLIADEPTSALDVTIQDQIMNLMKDLQKKLNTAVIMITHDFGIIAETCDAIAVVYAGQIVEYGTKRQIFKAPTHPYTLGLFGALPDMNADAERLQPVAGSPIDPTKLPSGCYFAARCEYAASECFETPIPLIDVGEGHLCRCLRCTGNGAKERQVEQS